MVDYRIIGKRIRYIREAEGMTQEQLAEKTDCSRVYISHIESGAHISLGMALSIAEGLGVSIEDIVLDCVENSGARFKGLDMMLFDCTAQEAEIITECVKAIRKILHGYTVK